MSLVHKALVNEMERKMRARVSGLDAEAMMRSWTPGGEMMEQFRKAFWAGTARDAKDKKGS